MCCTSAAAGRSHVSFDIVQLLVLLEFVRHGEALAAATAQVDLVNLVSAQVGAEEVAAGEAGVAQPTHVLLPVRRVHLHVLLEVVRACEAAAAQVADVRPLPAVHPNVALQLRRRPVRLVADGAVEWRIAATMLEHMQLHVTDRDELFGAESAHVARGHLMHRKPATAAVT